MNLLAWQAMCKAVSPALSVDDTFHTEWLLSSDTLHLCVCLCIGCIYLGPICHKLLHNLHMTVKAC